MPELLPGNLTWRYILSGKYKNNPAVWWPLVVIVVIGWLISPGIQARETNANDRTNTNANVKASTNASTNTKGKGKAKTKTQKKAPEEIITISKLKKPGTEFSLKRDIFSPDSMALDDPGEQEVSPRDTPPLPTVTEVPQVRIKTPEERRQEAEDQTRRELSYEGYVIKDSQSCALVTLNSELLAVNEGDKISEKIKIVKIQSNSITVEVPVNVAIEEKEETITHVFEIRIKGDEENEIQ